MNPWLAWSLIGAAFAADMAVVWGFLWFFRAQVNGAAVAAAMRTCLRGDNRDRAFKICLAAPDAECIRYCRTLLLLQTPRRALLSTPADYRGAVPARPFEALMAEAADAALAPRIRNAVFRTVLIAVAGFASAGASAFVLARHGPFPPESFETLPAVAKAATAAGAVGLLGALHALNQGRMLARDLRLVRRELVAELRPMEDLTEADRTANAKHRRPDDGSEVVG